MIPYKAYAVVTVLLIVMYPATFQYNNYYSKHAVKVNNYYRSTNYGFQLIKYYIDAYA